MHLKLKQHCKLTILQLKKKKKMRNQEDKKGARTWKEIYRPKNGAVNGKDEDGNEKNQKPNHGEFKPMRSLD